MVTKAQLFSISLEYNRHYDLELSRNSFWLVCSVWLSNKQTGKDIASLPNLR
jgi:hypothetical protein